MIWAVHKTSFIGQLPPWAAYIIGPISYKKMSIPRNVEVNCGNVQAMAFPYASFDGVTCNQVLHHLIPEDTSGFENVKCPCEGGLLCRTSFIGHTLMGVSWDKFHRTAMFMGVFIRPLSKESGPHIYMALPYCQCSEQYTG